MDLEKKGSDQSKRKESYVAKNEEKQTGELKCDQIELSIWGNLLSL